MPVISRHFLSSHHLPIDTEFMTEQITNAGLLIQPGVSHFSFLQDPEQFNNDVLHFFK